MARAIVVVHGVGSPAPGAEIRYLANYILGAGPKTISEPVPSSVPKLEVRDAAGGRVDLYEMNWSDLATPRHGFFAVLHHFIRVQLGMIQLAQAGWIAGDPGPAGPSLIGAMFRYVTLGVALWVLLIPTALLFIAISGKGSLGVAIVALLVIAAVLVAHLLSKDDRVAYAGYGWAAATLGAGGYIIATATPPETYLAQASFYAGLAETASGSLGILGTLEALARHWRRRAAGASSPRQVLVRGALYILPFSLLIGGFGALMVGLELYVAQRLAEWSIADGNKLNDLLHALSEAPGYSVVFMEVVNGTSTAVAVASILIAGLVWGGALRFGLVDGRKWGDALRSAVALWLALLMVLTAVVLLALGLDLSDRFPSIEKLKVGDLPIVASIVLLLSPVAAEVGTLTPMEVYKYSALRLVPAVIGVFPRLREALGISTDVMFHLLPSWSSLSTAGRTRMRLLDCLTLAHRESGELPVILAHSQGSRIVHDTLRTSPGDYRVVTVGSPIGTLHEGFLGLPVSQLTGPSGIGAWHNLYRDSDFIGGPIGHPFVIDELIRNEFRKSHFEYYAEPQVLAKL